MASAQGAFPSPQAPHPSPNALYSGEWKNAGTQPLSLWQPSPGTRPPLTAGPASFPAARRSAPARFPPRLSSDRGTPVDFFSVTAFRPLPCCRSSATSLPDKATPSASCAVAALLRARRRSRTPGGRTERQSRREHHPGHRPGKVRADAPCDTRRTRSSPIKKTSFAVPKSGEYGGAGGREFPLKKETL